MNVEIPRSTLSGKRSKKVRETSGYVYRDKNTGFWYARITYTEKSGKRRDVKRRVENKPEGYKVLGTLIEQVETSQHASIEAERMTLKDLCDFYVKHYLKPPQYANGRKVAGLRSHIQVGGYVKVFREYFGKQRLKTVTYEDIRTFRNKRLKTSTHQSGLRSLATVNREMAYLRRLLNIAERNGWIPKNPFKTGDSLIHVSDELKRERILTRDEETLLLAACVRRRAHIRPIIIAALDTGCRLGELLKMRWRDVDMNAGLITVQAFNTKTMKERQVSITNRLAIELEQLWRKSEGNLDRLIFGIERDMRHSFNGACKEAGLEKIRMHDLRHTHATRLDDLGFSLAKIGGQLGHTVMQTTLRYVNRDKAAVLQVAAALDAYQVDIEQAERTASELMN
jgi:integrase